MACTWTDETFLYSFIYEGQQGVVISIHIQQSYLKELALMLLMNAWFIASKNMNIWLTGLSWMPSWAQVITSSSSSKVPYPPAMAKPHNFNTNNQVCGWWFEAKCSWAHDAMSSDIGSFNRSSLSLVDIVCFGSLRIAVTLTVNAYVRKRFPHPHKKCFVLFSNRCGISQSIPLGATSSLAYHSVLRF